MGLRVGTLVTPTEQCEAGEVFQQCVGVITELREPEQESRYPVGTVWLQRCPYHGGQAAVSADVYWASVAATWQVGQLEG